MSRDTFEARTGLRLTDSDGDLKKSDDLPPMNTFLTAARAAGQRSEALFAASTRSLQHPGAGGLVGRA